MTLLRKYSLQTVLTCFVIIIFIGCNNDNITEPAFQTDDEYLSSAAIGSAFSSDADDDDNLFVNEAFDFDSDGPTADNPTGNDTPIDSLVKWGRRVTNVNTNANITTVGDTIKNVEVIRAVTGNFIIVGYINGVLDSTVKPYSQEQKRLVVFKRTGRRPNPRHNWRVYQYSAIDGETKTPQIGKDNIIINKVEFYRNNSLVLTLLGPDFTTNIFTSKFFGSDRIIDLSRNDQIKSVVYLTSNQNDTDIVSYHWARNSFGFHRERFTMTSQTPNGSGFDRIYERTFGVYSQHHHGIHNAFISANTRPSLYDNSISLFSSTYMGLPYRVRQ